MQISRIAIIGGGLSGLATGVHLRLLAESQSRPVEITLFESGPRLGGVIHTERIETTGDESLGENSPGGHSFIVDHGADMFATQPPAAFDLCERLGVTDRLLRPKPEGRGAMIARGNSMIPIPEGFVLMRPTKLMSILTTSLMSPGGKFRLLRERFVRTRDASVTDESVGDFVTRRLGRECLDNIVAPLVAGIYTADVYRLSMAATMKPIWDMESGDGSLARATLRRMRSGEDSTERGSSGARYEQFRAFPGGMIELIQTLADRIGPEHIRLNTPAESLTREASGTRVNPDGGLFDHVVLSTPAPTSTRLLGSLLDSARDSRDDSQTTAIETVVANLGKIAYASTAIVVMAVPRHRIDRLPKTFGFVVPPSENRAVLAGSFASEKFPLRSPESHVIIRAFVGGVLNPQILENEDDAIVETVANELGDLIGLDRSESLANFAAFVRVVRWNQAMPQYEVGHLDIAASITTAMQSIPGIELMTNAVGGVGIAPVIAAAERTAVRVLGMGSLTLPR